MKILLVHNWYRSASPGGEDRVVDQEAAALAGSGHAVKLFERFSDDIVDWPLARKALVPVRVVWSDEARRSLVRVVRSWRPDVVHVHNTFPLMSPSVLYACRAESVPVVATLHNYGLVCASGVLYRDGHVCHDCVGRLPLPGVRHGCYRDSSVKTLPIAASLVAHRQAWRSMVAAYVFLSAAQRDIVGADGFPTHRLFVKHNFVGSAAPAPEPPEDEDIVVYAGRLAEPKGLPLLMAAWDRYTRSQVGARLRLVIAGAGPLDREVGAWAASRPSVELRGVLDPESCASLMAKARACVVPSQWQETFGLVVAEAMAVGVPPVAPAHGSFPELITDGVDGVLFRPGDAGHLAAIFYDIESDPERYRELGRAGSVTHQKRFTREANLKELLRIYRFAMQNPTG